MSHMSTEDMIEVTRELEEKNVTAIIVRWNTDYKNDGKKITLIGKNDQYVLVRKDKDESYKGSKSWRVMPLNGVQQDAEPVFSVDDIVHMGVDHKGVFTSSIVRKPLWWLDDHRLLVGQFKDNHLELREEKYCFGRGPLSHGGADVLYGGRITPSLIAKVIEELAA